MIAHIVAALFNACWQGLALVGVTSLALRFLTRSSAATRYAIWFAALIAVAALPAIDFSLARSSPAWPVAVAPPARFTIVQTGTVTHPAIHTDTTARVNPTATAIDDAVGQGPDLLTQLRARAADGAIQVGRLLSSAAIPLALTWLFFSAALLFRLALAYGRLRSVKHGLTPFNDAQADRIVAGSARPVVVGIASDLAMPCVLGFAKPAIALPAKLAAELSPKDLERIIRHEHAHVRRWDDVANAVQLTVQAVMCFNPAVHIIGRCVDVEREIACDDFAVEPLAERLQYAKCLTHIAVNGFNRRQALPAPGFFFNRKQLVLRVERLLERGHNGSTTIAMAARYALAGLALVAVAVARVQFPVIAATTAPPSAVDPIRVEQVTRAARPIARAPHALDEAVHDEMTNVIRPAIQRTIQAAVKEHVTSSRLIVDRVVANLPALNARGQSPRGPAWVVSPASVAHVAVAVAHVAPVAAASHSGSSGEDFLDALAAAGYKNLSVDALVQLKSVGVDGALIDAAIRYSGARPSVEMLVRMASMGVDAAYLNQLRLGGYPRMSLADIVRMRSVGVDPDYIRSMTAALHSKPSIEQLTQLRSLGVDPDYVRSFAKLGYDKLSPNDLMRLRSIGVDAEYVRMLRGKGIGANGLSIEDLIRMKSVGVE